MAKSKQTAPSRLPLIIAGIGVAAIGFAFISKKETDGMPDDWFNPNPGSDPDLYPVDVTPPNPDEEYPDPNYPNQYDHLIYTLVNDYDSHVDTMTLRQTRQLIIKNTWASVSDYLRNHLGSRIRRGSDHDIAISDLKTVAL